MNQRFQARTEHRTEKTSVRFLKFKLAMLLLLCALPVYGVMSIGLHGGSWLFSAIYPLISLIAFGLYGHDKKQARTQGQRTPEKLLHGAELLGGWPGALVAQQVFRHKTRKFSYQLVFWLIVLLHELFWIDRLVLGGNFLTRHFY
ncbi:hypothetical protein BWR59_25110 [Pseudomonas sp. Bc-h]|jgi:uncharacterized membrane protein YsdA (DUF1294 family)|uniref:DUF1294 domain-containing protein n=1 Tax=Pseudomonas sp. Bc-h TaxID=1943632 RepID=UPI0009DB164A|nr:DUF1294 domain-containing protein [Pseudomonas sp. Bc-h]OQR28359.1 hypothetical protein BWR59_25110 [Pseudomonas sp. Bc-h]